MTGGSAFVTGGRGLVTACSASVTGGSAAVTGGSASVTGGSGLVKISSKHMDTSCSSPGCIYGLHSLKDTHDYTWICQTYTSWPQLDE